jgi:hypothetical protein
MAGAGITPENAPRMITLLSASLLVTELTSGAEPLAVVQALATSDLRTSEAGVGRSISAAPNLATFLSSFEWDVLAAATALSDHRRATAEQIGRVVAEALEADEHVVPLESRLQEAKRNAYRLLAAAQSGGGSGAGPGAAGGGQSGTAGTSTGTGAGGADTGGRDTGAGSGAEVLEQRDWDVLPPENAKAELDRLKSRLETEPGARLMISWRLTRDGGKG